MHKVSIMSKRLIVVKKYSEYPGRKRNRYRRSRIKVLGGVGKLYERNPNSEQGVFQKIMNRVHNDEEYFLRRQTSPKAYKRYFLNAPIQFGK